MAEHLASIFGAEKDRVSCPFYSRPELVDTVTNALVSTPNHARPYSFLIKHELSKYGEIESLNVRDNLADHLVGDVNVQFREQERASNALQNLTGRRLRVSLRLLGLVSEDLSDCSSKSSGSRLTVPSDQVRSSQLRSSVLSGPLYSDHVVRRSIRYFDICSLCEIW
uniref:RRM domain-containing protein n=1 Tax=Salix viminalis TaxID=40686 RepID=A0A6N2L576_SALVM